MSIEEMCQERLTLCERLIELEKISEEDWTKENEAEYVETEDRLLYLEKEVTERLGYRPFSIYLDEYKNYEIR